MITIFKCPSCKARIEYESNYCQNCGVKLEWEDEESEQEDISELSEDDLVVAYGLNNYFDSSATDSVKHIGGVAGYASVLLFTGLHDFLYAECSEIELCHSKNRLYGVAPNKKRDEINAALKDISVDYTPISGSNFGTFIIKIPSEEKVYTYPDVYMPNLFYKSIMSAISGKFDKSIYQSGLKDLPQKSEPNKVEEEPDEFDDL